MESDSSKPQLWYSSSRIELKETGLGFYDPNRFDWAAEVEANWESIEAEVTKFIQNHQSLIQPYFNTSMVLGKNKWSAFGFRFWLWGLNKNARECPNTMRILSRIPHLVSASVSLIGPNTEIKEHRGDTNAIYRCHLGLKIPEGLPNCGFAVAGEEKAWHEGKLLIFNDAAKHRAWNHSDSTRYVLLFDVIRPEFVPKKYTICSRVLAGIRMQMIRRKRPFIDKSPLFIRRIIATSNRILIYLILRLRNL